MDPPRIFWIRFNVDFGLGIPKVLDGRKVDVVVDVVDDDDDAVTVADSSERRMR